MVESLREIDGVTTRETRFFLAGIPANAKSFARAVRGHWAVENSLHWSLDVCIAEDDCRIGLGYAAENTAILRHIALNVLRKDTSKKKRGIKGKQKNASWDHSGLLPSWVFMRLPRGNDNKGFFVCLAGKQSVAGGTSSL